MLNYLFGSSPNNAPKQPAKMVEGKAFTISTITRGMCLEVRSTGLFTGNYDSSGGTQSQLWTIERNEDKTAVAVRSVSNGQYLRAAVRGDNAKVQTGAKSWWTLEQGDAPGAWWLKNNDHGNYLTNYYGHQTANNKVIMWSSNLVSVKAVYVDTSVGRADYSEARLELHNAMVHQ